MKKFITVILAIIIFWAGYLTGRLNKSYYQSRENQNIQNEQSCSGIMKNPENLKGGKIPYNLKGIDTYKTTIQELNSSDDRSITIRNIIEVADREDNAPMYESQLQPLLYSEKDEDVLIGTLEFYDYHFFHDINKIYDACNILLARGDLSEEVLSHIGKILSEYDVERSKIEHMITGSPSFSSLDSTSQEMLKSWLKD